MLQGKTFSNKDNNDLLGTIDLKPENIKEGITYAGIIGNLKEKLTNIDFIYNIPSGYTIKQYIPNEGIYCLDSYITPGTLYLFDMI